jgi:hypothetical protein
MSIIIIAVVPIILLIIISIFMENAKASAKDFFLHLGAMVGLYTVTVSFINLIFKIVSKAFPEIGQNIYAWGVGSEISLPVATLIVFFPIFIILSRMVHKIYIVDPAKKDIWIRRWITYITLFAAGIALAIDLVMVLYKFLDGQDLSGAFLLKALTVIMVAGAIFWFYIQDIRDKVSAKNRKVLSIVLGIVILAFIILGFSVLGSPQTQRLIRYDNQKVTDLQNIQWQVISYWQTNGMLPISLNDIKIAQQYTEIPNDPQSKTTYEYKKVEAMTFELCAEFNKEETDRQSKYNSSVAMPTISYDTKGDYLQNSNWNHGTGRTCFTRVIDPVQYPTQIKG